MSSGFLTCSVGVCCGTGFGCWIVKTPAEKAKAIRIYDIKRAKAFDETLQGKQDDDDRWERHNFDRNAKVEKTVQDLPETPVTGKAIDFESSTAFEGQTFVSKRDMVQFRGSTSAETRHEDAIFGTTTAHDVAVPAASDDALTGIILPAHVRENFVGVAGGQLAQPQDEQKKKSKWLSKLQAKRQAATAAQRTSTADTS
eukprot:m.404312 g.404312  ORF g.404312 m.404312 type:complete len:199 (+) comp21196_c1_seq32:490-1086(+)